MLKETDIKKSVFDKIRGGEVSMRPRLYFIVRVSLLAALAVVLFALAMFVLSFAFFSIHESGEQFLLGFGQHGLMTFIALFPWVPFIITVGLLVLLDYLLRYFKFGYRVSALEIFLLALAAVLAAGMVINLTPLHSTLLSDADRGGLPLIGAFYSTIHDSHQEFGIYRGTIFSIEGGTLIIGHNDGDRDTDDGTTTVIVPDAFDTSTLYVGERVYVNGKSVQGVVHAYGIEPFDTPDEQ